MHWLSNEGFMTITWVSGLLMFANAFVGVVIHRPIFLNIPHWATTPTKVFSNNRGPDAQAKISHNLQC